MYRWVFGQALDNAKREAQSMHYNREYKAVYVLLLSWADDKTGGYEAVQELQRIFHDQYHFRTEKWTIPQHNSSALLSQKLKTFQEKPQEEDMSNPSEIADGKKPPENKDFLRIVYYAGHSQVRFHDRCYISFDDEPESPQVDWSILETQFGHLDADVLILLDCNYSTWTGNVVSNNRIEIISGTGFGWSTSAASRYFFTLALCEVLEDLSSGPPFSAAMLHQHVFARIHNRTAGNRPAGDRPNSELIPEYKRVDTSMTPRYGALKGGDCRESIVLANKSPGLSKLTSPSSRFQLSLTAPYLTDLRPTTGPPPVGLFQSVPEPLRTESRCLRTLVSLTLSGHSSSETQVQEMVDILSFMPLVKLEKTVPIEGKTTIPFFRPNAPEFLISMPIGYWNLLPKDPSITLKEYVDVLHP
ncbi:hypothetical protein MMC27_006348 [Xylographa pallens]|nr:hypothetical protein [Xylographa pallens]